MDGLEDVKKLSSFEWAREHVAGKKSKYGRYATLQGKKQHFAVKNFEHVSVVSGKSWESKRVHPPMQTTQKNKALLRDYYPGWSTLRFPWFKLITSSPTQPFNDRDHPFAGSLQRHLGGAGGFFSTALRLTANCWGVCFWFHMYRKIYIDDMIWVYIRICCRCAKISTFLFLFRVFFNNWSFFHWNVPWTSETGFVSSKIPSTANAPENRSSQKGN